MHLRKHLQAATVLLGLAAPSYADRLTDLQACMTHTRANTTQPMQLNCTTDVNGTPRCTGVIMQYSPSGVLSTNGADYERFLAITLSPDNETPSDLTAATSPTTQLARNLLASTLAPNTEAYQSVSVDCGPENPLNITSVTSQPAAVTGATPSLDALVAPIVTGMNVADENVLANLEYALRGVFLYQGNLLQVYGRAALVSHGVYRLELAPLDGPVNSGKVVLTLSDVSFNAEAPLSGMLVRDDATDISTQIDVSVCFVDRIPYGQLLVGEHTQCVHLSSGEPSKTLDFTRMYMMHEGVPSNTIFKDGFETGNMNKWSTQP